MGGSYRRTVSIMRLRIGALKINSSVFVTFSLFGLALPHTARSETAVQVVAKEDASSSTHVLPVPERHAAPQKCAHLIECTVEALQIDISNESLPIKSLDYLIKFTFVKLEIRGEATCWKVRTGVVITKLSRHKPLGRNHRRYRLGLRFPCQHKNLRRRPGMRISRT